jgi:hypothetical protein
MNATLYLKLFHILLVHLHLHLSHLADALIQSDLQIGHGCPEKNMLKYFIVRLHIRTGHAYKRKSDK